MRDDPRATRLYEWEDEYVFRKSATTLRSGRECEEFLLYAAGWLGIPAPRVIVTKLPVVCWARPGDNTIRLAPWGRNSGVMLHELAHLADYYYAPGNRVVEAHGEQFLTIAMDLYSHFLGIKRSYLEKTAARMGLSYGPPRFLLNSNHTPAACGSDEDFFPDDF